LTHPYLININKNEDPEEPLELNHDKAALPSLSRMPAQAWWEFCFIMQFFLINRTPIATPKGLTPMEVI